MVGNLSRRPHSSAPTTQTAVLSCSTAAASRNQAESLLREMAFVLHLTRSVKQRILEEYEPAASGQCVAG